MRLGIGTYTFGWAIGVDGYTYDIPKMTLPELIDKAVAMGCSVVQICDNFCLDGLGASCAVALSQKASRGDLGLQVGTRGITPEHLNQYLSIARMLNADLVRSMLPGEGPGSRLDEAVAMLRDIMPSFEQAGVLLSLENHDRHKSADLLTLMEAVDSPNLGICLDTVNSFGAAEDPERVMDALLPVANCLHIKDFTINRVLHQMGFSVTGAPAGAGMLNIDRAIGEFVDHNPSGSIILELWTPFQGSMEATVALEAKWADQSMSYLTKHVASFQEKTTCRK